MSLQGQLRLFKSDVNDDFLVPVGLLRACSGGPPKFLRTCGYHSWGRGVPKSQGHQEEETKEGDDLGLEWPREQGLEGDGAETHAGSPTHHSFPHLHLHRWEQGEPGSGVLLQWRCV